MALPDVEEKTHFRLPGFRVADKLLAHLQHGDTHAIEHAWRNRAPKRLVAEYDSR